MSLFKVSAFLLGNSGGSVVGGGGGACRDKLQSLGIINDCLITASFFLINFSTFFLVLGFAKSFSESPA
jgi:hypothetical protein